MILGMRRMALALGILLLAAVSCRSVPAPPVAERDAGRVKQVLARALTLSRDPGASPEDVDRLFLEAVLAAEGTPAEEEAAEAWRQWRGRNAANR